ncbi:MAG: hypothetical protein ACRC1K_23925, partial [Planctomycetia bacterium]
KGKPLAVIAAELDVPLGTIKRRLHVARKRFEECVRASGSSAVPTTEAAMVDEPIFPRLDADEEVGYTTDEPTAYDRPTKPAAPQKVRLHRRELVEAC